MSIVDYSSASGMSADPEGVITPSHEDLLDTKILNSENWNKHYGVIEQYRRFGIDKDEYLPRLVVLGERQWIKLSLLESLTGIPFPAISSYADAHFAIEIVLRRANDDGCACASIVPCIERTSEEALKGLLAFEASFTRNELGRQSFSAFLDKSTKYIKEIELDVPGAWRDPYGGYECRTLSGHLLRIELSGRNYPHFRILDFSGTHQDWTNLPGDGDVFTGFGGKIQHHLGPIYRYINDPRVIILAAANSTYTSSIFNYGALPVASKVDPESSRTIGIIAAYEEITPGVQAEVIGLACGKIKKLHHGWFVIRKRLQEESIAKVTLEDCCALENQFFKKPQWEPVDSNRLGIENLKSYIGRIMLDQVSDAIACAISGGRLRPSAFTAAKDSARIGLPINPMPYLSSGALEEQYNFPCLDRYPGFDPTTLLEDGHTGFYSQKTITEENTNGSVHLGIQGTTQVVTTPQNTDPVVSGQGKEKEIPCEVKGPEAHSSVWTPQEALIPSLEAISRGIPGCVQPPDLVTEKSDEVKLIASESLPYFSSYQLRKYSKLRANASFHAYLNDWKLFLEDSLRQPISFWPLSQPHRRCKKNFIRLYFDCVCMKEMSIDIPLALASSIQCLSELNEIKRTVPMQQTHETQAPNNIAGKATTYSSDFAGFGRVESDPPQQRSQWNAPSQLDPAALGGLSSSPSKPPTSGYTERLEARSTTAGAGNISTGGVNCGNFVGGGSSSPSGVALQGCSQGTSINTNQLPGQFDIFFVVHCTDNRTVMKAIEMMGTHRDSDLFQNIRRSYNLIRGWRRFFSFTTICDIQWVKFKRYSTKCVSKSDGLCDGILESLPAETDRNYQIESREPPRPMVRPISRQHIMELYEAPQDSENCNECLRTAMPKWVELDPDVKRSKLKESAWGIYGVEGFALFKILVWAFIINLIPLVLFVPWWLKSHPGDLQNAFVPSAVVSMFYYGTVSICVSIRVGTLRT
ncbi:hypothetical protein TWF481_001479 [Arthrobotrys musiformis]|uniref:Uncharacterized protein n=1 Tax=Arthrobotrys musiformis TaxID=47236 RepID=A0AAV9WQM6_9PEZI